MKALEEEQELRELEQQIRAKKQALEDENTQNTQIQDAKIQDDRNSQITYDNTSIDYSQEYQDYLDGKDRSGFLIGAGVGWMDADKSIGL